MRPNVPTSLQDLRYYTGADTPYYDAVGNQTKRIIGQDTFDLFYDAENRMVSVEKNSALFATFVYDGDSKRVKAIWEGDPHDTVIAYVGDYYEYEVVDQDSTASQYYYAGAARVVTCLT